MEKIIFQNMKFVMYMEKNNNKILEREARAY